MSLKTEPDPQIWDVLCMGETLGSLARQGDGLYRRDIGGDAANVAISVARMGGQVAIVTRLGRDAFGDDAAQVFEAAGVDMAHVHRDAHRPTGHRLVHAAGDDAAVSYARDGASGARLRPGDVPADGVARARVLHVSGVTLGLSASARAAAEIAAEQARAAGVLVSFAPTFQPQQWGEDEALSPFLAMASRADLLILTLDQAQQLFGSAAPEVVIERVLNHGPQMVALCGHAGAWVATRAGRSFVLSDRPNAPHPLAVQDVFVGTFLSGLTAGDDLLAVTARAVQAASLSAGRPGEAASIPGLEDLLIYPETAIKPSAARVQPMSAGP